MSSRPWEVVCFVCVPGKQTVVARLTGTLDDAAGKLHAHQLAVHVPAGYANNPDGSPLELGQARERVRA